MTKGPITMPTPEGTAAAGKLLRLPPGGQEEQELDHALRRLPDRSTGGCATSAPPGRPARTAAPNDHSDGAYDDTIRDRLDEVHSAIGPILRRMAAIEPRLAGYRPRLQEALDKFDEGESNWLASPLMDSYHTVWMHLHQELILMLGLTRADDEAREERLVSGRT